MIRARSFRERWVLLAGAIALAVTGPSAAADSIPTLSEAIGFDPCLPGAVLEVSDVSRALQEMARSSGRIRLSVIGLSTEGRPIWCAHVSSEENLARLEELRRSREKLFALVTCGVHPLEVAGAPAGLQLLRSLLALETPRARELLEAAVVAIVPCMNPDGTHRVARWLRSGADAGNDPPFLQHPVAGHDLNRDWLLGTQSETRAVIEGIYRLDHPWITLDVHQMGSRGPRLFLPPYAFPVDPEVSSDLLEALEHLSDRMMEGLAAAGVRGYTRRSGYDAWSPSRAFAFYHGGIRVLLEAASGDRHRSLRLSPSDVRVFGRANVPSPDHPQPWPGGEWGLPEASRTLALAVGLALAATLDEPVRGAQARHLGERGGRDGVVLEGDAGSARALLAALERSGARLQLLGPGQWIVRDAPWGSGWTRTILLPHDYPASAPEPYDVSSHDLAALAGLGARPASPEELAISSRGGSEPALRRLAGRLPGRTAREIVLVGGSDLDVGGWTRFALAEARVPFEEWNEADLTAGMLDPRPDRTIILCDASQPLASGLRARIEEQVAAGARIVALGRRARELGRGLAADLEEVTLGDDPGAGSILRVSAPAGGQDGAVGGTLPRAVIHFRGSAWRVIPGGKAESLLVVDSERPLISGILRGEGRELPGAAVLVRIRGGTAGGERLLFGFPPAFRGWCPPAEDLLVRLSLE